MNIYLRACLEARSRRVAKRSGISYEIASDVVAMKDKETRKLFKRLYGFDIQEDLHVFDHIIDTDTLTRREVFEKINCCLMTYPRTRHSC